MRNCVIIYKRKKSENKKRGEYFINSKGKKIDAKKIREEVKNTYAEAISRKNLKGFIEDLPVKSSSVDWVISNCVINLSPEKEKVFSEISRVLKPGGRMVVSDMVGENIPEWLRENKNLYSACISGVISEKEYLSGLRKVGLEKVKVSEHRTYKSDELESFIKSTPEIGEDIQRIIRGLDIKVASVKISAYKPIF